MGYFSTPKKRRGEGIFVCAATVVKTGPRREKGGRTQRLLVSLARSAGLKVRGKALKVNTAHVEMKMPRTLS